MALKADVIVRQISTRGGSYVNVLSGLNEGGVGVWGYCYQRPTYLLMRGHNWLMVTFDDDDWCDQELPKLIKSWAAQRVFELPEMKEWEKS